MNLVWYKFTKYFRGGTSEVLCLCEDEKDAENKATRWAEKSRGGKESGWKVDWNKYIPTKDELKSFIDYKMRHSRHIIEDLKETQAHISIATQTFEALVKKEEG